MARDLSSAVLKPNVGNWENWQVKEHHQQDILTQGRKGAVKRKDFAALRLCVTPFDYSQRGWGA